MNRPRIYLALQQSSPPYNKAQFFDKGRISPCLFRTFLIAVCAFTRCILTHTEIFTPHPPGPKPGVQLFELMRAVWLSASFLKTGWMLRTMLTTVTNAGWRGDILKTPFQCFTSEKGGTLASAFLVWSLLPASFITRCGAFTLKWSERADKEFLFFAVHIFLYLSAS